MWQSKRSTPSWRRKSLGQSSSQCVLHVSGKKQIKNFPKSFCTGEQPGGFLLPLHIFCLKCFLLFLLLIFRCRSPSASDCHVVCSEMLFWSTPLLRVGHVSYCSLPVSLRKYGHSLLISLKAFQPAVSPLTGGFSCFIDCWTWKWQILENSNQPFCYQHPCHRRWNDIYPSF